MHGYFERAVYRNVSDGRTRWRGLMGYGLLDRPEGPGTWRRLSTVLDDRKLFPEPDRYHLDLWVRIDKEEE